MRLHPVVWLCLPCILITACQQADTRSAGLNSNLFIKPTPPPAPAIVGTMRPLVLPELDFRSLELSEFIPPGATPIWPEPRVKLRLYETPKGKFPSTEEVVSPDNTGVVGSRSEEAYRGMRHWLRLFRRGDSAAKSLLWSSNSFDALWSQDSQGLAVTHYVGKNNAEVLTVRVRDDRQTHKVDIRKAIEPYFSPALLDSARFEIAYRWSEGRILVMRGIGRLGAEPYDIFGYEIAIDSEYPEDASRMQFIRGYIKNGQPAKPIADTTTAPK
jgi:hypothetical protein